MNKNTVAVGALGGTIAMTRNEDEAGMTAKIGATELVARIPDLDSYAEIRTETLFRQASCSLSFAQLFTVLDWAEKQRDAGGCGVVLSQGTDTIEQTAFFFDLFWNHPEPLVVTGALRGPQAPGFDGLANLRDAVIVAATAESRGRGVLVVLNDTVHEARRVRKAHTTLPDAFQSPIHGPVGMVSEGAVDYLRASRRPGIFARPCRFSKQVLLFEHGLDDDPTLIDRALDHGIDGIVISAVGTGHVSEALRDALVRAVSDIPVIICSRTGSGSTTKSLYGYKGSEIDLQENGCLMGGWLPALKARILLLAALWQDLDRETLAARLADWAGAD